MAHPDGPVAYHSDHLGVVSPEVRDRIVDLVKHDGLSRVLSRLPYILESYEGSASRDALVAVRDIEKKINRAFGKKDFLFRKGAPGWLPHEISRPWREFVGTVSEIVCEREIETNLPSSGVLITNQTLHDQIAYISLANSNLEVGNRFSYVFRDHSLSLTCPDGIVIDPEYFRVYEYKSGAHGSSSVMSGSANHIRQAFNNDRERNLLAHALSQLTNIPVTQLPFPQDGENLPIQTIIAASLAGQTADIADYERYYGVKPVVLGIPSMKNLAYLIMEMLVGRVDHRQGWENNVFIPLDETRISMLTMMRSTHTALFFPKRVAS